MIKQAPHESPRRSLDDQLDLKRDLQRAAGHTEDYREGGSVFLEKRKAPHVGKVKSNERSVAAFGVGPGWLTSRTAGCVRSHVSYETCQRRSMTRDEETASRHVPLIWVPGQ